MVSCATEKAIGELENRLRDYNDPIEIYNDAERIAVVEDADLVVGGLREAPASNRLSPR